VARATEDRAWGLLTRLDSYFALASVKAALILPADAVLLAVTAAGVYQLRSSATTVALGLPVKLALVATLASALASVAFALLVTAAFLKSGNRTGDYASMVFFGSIKSMERHTFTRTFAESDTENFADDVLQQVHLLSAALHDKYVLLNWSAVFCVVGYAALAVAAFVMLWGL
jgi:hypothetical protein